LTTLAASRRRITAAAAAAAAADDDQDEDDDDDVCRRQQTTYAACRPTEQGRSRLLKSGQAMAGPARPPTTALQKTTLVNVARLQRRVRQLTHIYSPQNLA